MTSDKATLAAYLTAQINPAVLLVNSGKTRARYSVIVETGDLAFLLSKYVNERKLDVLLTVSRIREDPQRVRADNIPREINDYLQVKILSIDRPQTDGDDIRDLAFGEVTRILAASSGAYRYFSSQEQDRKLDKQQIFNSVITVLKVTES